jgi:hypothetical protein
MALSYRLRHRLAQLSLEQRDLASAAQSAEIQPADSRMTLSQLLQSSPAGLGEVPNPASTPAPGPAVRATPPVASPVAHPSRKAPRK